MKMLHLCNTHKNMQLSYYYNKSQSKKKDFAGKKKLRVFTALFRSKQIEKGLVEVGIIIKGYDWMKK